jgi:hypothetical protein
MATANGNGTTQKLSRLSKAELLEVIEAQQIGADLLVESMAELKLQVEDEGWRRLTWDGRESKSFDTDDIVTIIDMTRAAYLANPLIHHAVEIQADYVMGQGCSVLAKPLEEVNQTLQAFWDNPQNKKVLTDQVALWNREVQLRTDANIFFVLFANPFNGETIVRIIPPEEFIRSGPPITNPDDREEVWFYKRSWYSRDLNLTTGTFNENPTRHEEYYPDINFNPDLKPETINGKRVNWDSPVYHVKVGNLPGEPYGVPDIYNALAWARAVKLDMEDYATIRRALSRFAWRLTVKGGGKNGVAQARSKLHSALNEYGNDDNPPPLAGSTAIMGEERDLQPFRLAGTTLDPEEGRRLWLLVAAGVSLPENILTGDAKAGALASARTLDRPTELHMRNRQVLWETVLHNISMWVLGQSAQAILGSVQGDFINGVLELRARRVPVFERNPQTGRNRQGRPRSTTLQAQKVEVTVNFPPILERNNKEMVGAVVDAATLAGRNNKGLFSKSDIRRRLLKALGEPDVDGAMERILEELEDPEEQPDPVTMERGNEDRSPLPRDIEPLTNNEDANAPNARSGGGGPTA